MQSSMYRIVESINFSIFAFVTRMFSTSLWEQSNSMVPEILDIIVVVQDVLRSSVIFGFGSGIRDWDWGLGLWTGIGDWDWGLVLGTGIGDWDWGLGLGNGEWGMGNGEWENGNGK